MSSIRKFLTPQMRRLWEPLSAGPVFIVESVSAHTDDGPMKASSGALTALDTVARSVASGEVQVLDSDSRKLPQRLEDFLMVGHVIAVGGPRNNRVAEAMLAELGLGGHTLFGQEEANDQDERPIYVLKYDPGEEPVRCDRDEDGIITADYGISIRARNPLNEEYTWHVFAGTRGIGTRAACLAVSTREGAAEIMDHMVPDMDLSLDRFRLLVHVWEREDEPAEEATNFTVEHDFRIERPFQGSVLPNPQAGTELITQIATSAYGHGCRVAVFFFGLLLLFGLSKHAAEASGKAFESSLMFVLGGLQFFFALNVVRWLQERTDEVCTLQFSALGLIGTSFAQILTVLGFLL